MAELREVVRTLRQVGQREPSPPGDGGGAGKGDIWERRHMEVVDTEKLMSEENCDTISDMKDSTVINPFVDETSSPVNHLHWKKVHIR